MALEWIDKYDGEDIYAEHVNALAHAIKDNETGISNVKTKVDNIKKVAITGSYNDLDDKPINATTTKGGFMSAQDKATLDSLKESVGTGGGEKKIQFSCDSSIIQTPYIPDPQYDNVYVNFDLSGMFTVNGQACGTMQPAKLLISPPSTGVRIYVKFNIITYEIEMFVSYTTVNEGLDANVWTFEVFEYTAMVVYDDTLDSPTYGDYILRRWSYDILVPPIPGSSNNYRKSLDVNMWSALKPVAFTGKYSDLIGAFSGSYNDLSNKPTNATTEKDGFMSAEDKAKISAINTNSDTGNTASGIETFIGGGGENTVNGDGSSISGGYLNTVSGEDSFIGGGINNTVSGDGSSISGGYLNTASGYDSFVGGGTDNTSSGNESFVGGGSHNTAYVGAFAAGHYNTALGYQTKLGHFTIDGTQGAQSGILGDAFSIGNGTGPSQRSNAFRVAYNGNVYGLAAFNSTGADYAEFFEWLDGNTDNADRRGLFVTLDGDKIRIANSTDTYILGVISAAPGVIGNNHADAWQGRYKTDIFGKVLTHMVHYDAEYEEREVRDSETSEVTKEQILISEAYDSEEPIINPDYDPNEEYIPREKRPEWGIVGMMGQLVVIDDGTCEVNGYCKPADDGTATAADKGYRVIARLDDTHIKVLFR
ncbi:MAG: hypothetical protein J1F01_05715 [Oscillospiraceae bacterium]|nr:hypothetical protein [Oscillospiraceae bacterium]